MVGSVANPVRFANPFRKLVEVHWRDPSQITHITISLLLDADLRFSAGGASCPGTGGPFPPAYAGSYQSYVRYYNNSGTIIGEGPPYNNLDYLRDGEWDVGAAPTGAVVVGLPDLSADAGRIDFSAWQYVAQASAGVGVLPVTPQWATPSGSSLGISTPGGESEFVTGLPVVQVQGQEFIGGPACYSGGFAEAAEIDGSLTQYGQFSPVPDTVRIETANDGTFAPIGSALTSFSTAGVPGTFVSGQMWVLFEKVT